MATYRTIRMSFWNSPAIENMPPEQKLLYLYLFTSPHTNNLGVLSVTIRKIAFETGMEEEAVRDCLDSLAFHERIVMEDGDIWVCGFIRHQCTTSPKILTSLRALLPTVESAAIRRAILERYPHLFGAAPYPSDRVSLPSGESEREVEKETSIRSPERERASFAPPVEETPLPCTCWSPCNATSPTWTWTPKSSASATGRQRKGSPSATGRASCGHGCPTPCASGPPMPHPLQPRPSCPPSSRNSPSSAPTPKRRRSTAGRWPATRSTPCAAMGHSRRTCPEPRSVNRFPSFPTPR